MIDQLEDALKLLPDLLKDESKWDSLIVNRRKPYTYRVFTVLPNGMRLCLHKFDPCHTHEAFKHPHPWPGAFVILQGSYRMWLGRSPDQDTNHTFDVATVELTRFSKYEIVEPNTWHNVIPLEPTYTVMVNDKPWSSDDVHSAAPTTKGKDLDKMPPMQLTRHLQVFGRLVNEYLGDKQRKVLIEMYRSHGATGVLTNFGSVPYVIPLENFPDKRNGAEATTFDSLTLMDMNGKFIQEGKISYEELVQHAKYACLVKYEE